MKITTNKRKVTEMNDNDIRFEEALACYLKFLEVIDEKKPAQADLADYMAEHLHEIQNAGCDLYANTVIPTFWIEED